MTNQTHADEAATSLDMPKALAEAITQVMSKVGKLAKEEKNQHGNYNFASIDAFLEAVQPACTEAGLFIMQDEDEFEIRDGWLVLRYRFTLGHKSGVVWAHQPRRTIMVHAKQGSQAFGAAQSYALKQFMRSLFQIATGDKEDADSHPHSDLPAGRRQPQAPAKTYTGKAQRGNGQQAAKQPEAPPDNPINVVDAEGEVTAYKRTKRGALDAMAFIESEIDRVQQIEDQAALWRENADTFHKLAQTVGNLRPQEGAQTIAERVEAHDKAFRQYMEAA